MYTLLNGRTCHTLINTRDLQQTMLYEGIIVRVGGENDGKEEWKVETWNCDSFECK